MTTPKKTYSNYRFDELISFSKHNPHRSRGLIPIEISTTYRITKNETILDGWGLKGYTVMDLQPTGMLSMLLCMRDVQAYSLSSPAIRSQQIMGLCTKLQEKTEDLRNGPLSRKRKKIYDLIGAIYNESNKLEDKDYFDLFQGLETLEEVHFIMIKDTVQESTETETKENMEMRHLYFSSSPYLWKRDRPIWMVDYRARWMAIPSTNDSISIASWAYNELNTLEEKGWIIHWPEIEATKTELVEQLSILPTWKEVDKKLTKDILSQRLGKAKSIEWFNNQLKLNTDLIF